MPASLRAGSKSRVSCHPRRLRNSRRALLTLPWEGSEIGLPKSLRWQIVFDEKFAVFRLDFAPGDENAEGIGSPPQRSENIRTMHDSSSEGLPLAGSQDKESGKGPLEGSHPAPKKTLT